MPKVFDAFFGTKNNKTVENLLFLTHSQRFTF